MFTKRKQNKIIKQMAEQYDFERYLQSNPPTLDEVRERVFAAAARMDAEGTTGTEKAVIAKKKKPALRRVGKVAAITAAVLIAAFGISVAMPDPVGNAGNLMRRTLIWLGDTLHLDVKVETPVENLSGEKSSVGNMVEVESLDDVKSTLGVSLPYPVIANNNMQLSSFSISYDYSPFSVMNYTYSNNSSTIRFFIQFTGDNGSSWINEDDIEVYSNSLGTFYIHERETDPQFIITTFTNNLEITMRVSSSKDEIYTLLDSLSWK